MFCNGVFEARCVQGRLRRQLPLLESSEWLGGSVVMRCVLLPVPWSGSEDFFNIMSIFKHRGTKKHAIIHFGTQSLGE